MPDLEWKTIVVYNILYTESMLLAPLPVKRPKQTQ